MVIGPPDLDTGGMVNRADMRAADGDRERVAEMLRNAHAEGRLGQDELLERIDATYEAVTFRDLDRLIEDLPVQRSPASALVGKPRSAPPEQLRTPFARRAARAVLSANWWVYGGIVALVTTVWGVLALLGDVQPFWPIWVAGPWGVFMGFWELLYRATDQRRPGRDA